MNTYDTSGIPLGSTEVKVLFNNASNLDDAVNDLINTTWVDRFGNARKTWTGLEKDSSDALLALGYEFIGDYDAAGELTFTRTNQVMSKGGEYWRPGPSLTLPYTTVNNWAIDQPKFVSVGDAALRTALADAVSLSNGAALVGRTMRHINTLAELKTITGRYNYDMVYMERVDPAYDGGNGPFIWSSTSTSTANDFTIVAATGISTGRWLRIYDDLEAGMFGARPVAGFDNATAFAAIETFLRAELAAFRKLPTVWLNAGTYECSVAPNWGIQGAVILNRGKVKIRGTGTGSAMILDAGATFGVNITALTIGLGTGFVFENGPSSTAPTVLVRNVYLSEIRGRVWGAGLTQTGWSILGCVLSKFWIGATPTESAKENPADYVNGWYLGGKPLSGMTISQSAAFAQASYNIFYNWIGAACQIGMYIDSTLGNVWLGGDNEYCSDTGAIFTSLAIGNRAYGLNEEVNTITGITCAGSFNEFNVDSVKFFFTGGSGNRLVGGMHDQITISGGTGNFVGGVTYGRGLSGNLVIPDAGTRSGFGQCYQAQSQKWGVGSSVSGSITVTGSPFVYTNNTGRPLIVGVSGGTVSISTYFRGATNLGSTAGGGTWILSPGDALSVTYTATPTMNFASA
jgi:hypothetical protein